MIPPEGRDVQCSNCSTTWFQPGRRADQAAQAARPTSQTPETGDGLPASDDVDWNRVVDANAAESSGASPQGLEARDPQPEPETTPESGQSPVAEAEPDTAAASRPEPEAGLRTEAPEADADEPEDTDTDIPAGVAAAMAASAVAASTVTSQTNRPELDPTLRDILREEAEREARLRQAEATGVETQAEMPLDEEPAASQHPDRVDLEAAADAFDPEAAKGDDHASRGALLPDIEEINSTLRDSGDRSGDEADASDIDTIDKTPRRRHGVRIGFLLIVLLAIAGLFVYTSGDQLVDMVPGAEPAVDGFTQVVNDVRFWLDDLARSLGASSDEG